ncbi:unnamed protein product [Nippostrongylus brasiliensis]|uniref:Apple domain-containing protein n=1 Tax=Nippostrongylus brasiliensis TaxID=27835 RepID=A0A3P7B0Z6_NIPBR|nr:unnamed protein product [Nippostrongylus brasiliensis]
MYILLGPSSSTCIFLQKLLLTRRFQFKDECLRLCLLARVRGTRCLSAMHIPGDDQCVISDQDQITRPDLFVENDAHHSFTVNYFRNTCVDPPLGGVVCTMTTKLCWISEGGRLEARLTGFRGGEGILELAQRKGQNPKLLAIMTGLQENKFANQFAQLVSFQNFHLIYAPDVELSSCYKAGLLRDHQGKKLITIDSDSRGMAIQPWTEIDFHILDDSIIDKVIVVVEDGTSNVVDCGKLQIHGNTSDWQRALNGGTMRFSVAYVVSALVAFFVLH